MKIHLVEAEVIHVDRETDGQTDYMKVIGACHKYVNEPKNSKLLQYGFIVIDNLYPEYILYV